MSQLVPSFSPSYWNENDTEFYFSTMYKDWEKCDDIQGFRFEDQNFQLDAFNRRVPTRTTPTITPVTPALRNFETISRYSLEIESHQNEAGFEPPLVQPMPSMLNSMVNVATSTTVHLDHIGSGENMYANIGHTKSWPGGNTAISELPSLINVNNGRISPSIPPHVLAMSSNSSSPTSSSSSKSRKNTGGRRPNKENGISPEEENKKQLRRERNKIAAAKCRKKRTEQIQNLEQEVKHLDGVKREFNDKIEQLKKQSENLRKMLESHESSCRIRESASPEDIKPFDLDANELNQQLLNVEKSLNMINNEDAKLIMPLYISPNVDSRMMDISHGKQRPNYLPVSSNSYSMKNNKNELTGIPITTPSAEIFSSLIEGGTGLTPITSAFGPTCSTQLRNINNVADLSSPDSMSTKLVSL